MAQLVLAGLERAYDVFALALDAGDDAAVTAAIDLVAARGRLDILHSHAGIQVPGRLTDIGPEGMDASWRLNVRAHFIAARAAMPQMQRQRKGSIIITASNSGVQYDRGMIAYCTTKHAVIAMTRQIAVDYARFGVRCNALCPGFVDTPLTRQNTFPMPFLITAEKAAQEIIVGLEKGEFEIHFPKAFTRTLRTLRILPYSLYFAAVRKITANKNKTELGHEQNK